jgi:hypothetical protein
VVSTAIKRAWLRTVKINGANASLSLRQALEAELVARTTAIQSGGQISAISANGASVSFSTPSMGLSPESIVELCDEMLTRYDYAAVSLGGTPTDDEILIEMLSILLPARRLTVDFTEIRTGPCAVEPA